MTQHCCSLCRNKAPSMVEALTDDILEIVNTVVREKSPDPAAKDAAAASTATEEQAERSKPAPAVSFWKGPELHTGLRPQPANDAASGLAPAESATASEGGVGELEKAANKAPRTLGQAEVAKTSAVATSMEDRNEGANVGAAPPSEPRKLQVKPLKSAKPSAFGLALRSRATPMKAKPSTFASMPGKGTPSTQVAARLIPLK